MFTEKERAIIDSFHTSYISSYKTLEEAYNHPQRRRIIFDEQLVCIITRNGENYNIVFQNGVLLQRVDKNSMCVLMI